MATPTSKTSAAVLDNSANNGSNPERERVFSAYRQWGYLEGDLDPLGFLRPRDAPELEKEGEYAREARAIYSSTIGVEINHIYSPERRRWIYDRMESEPPQEDQKRILELLTRADIFEQVMQQRYLGSKRFSLEGTTALIPLVDEVLDTASRLGAIELVMGMSHRGRLNVIAHVAQRPAQEIFAGFEDVDPRSVLGSGDVKYHMGATGEYATKSGGKVHIHLVSNPSHLEAVDPVTVGRTRAKQDRTGEGGREKYLPLLVHGDAAFAGQGVLAETMNYADLPGYTVGGTIHVVVNNLLGFTTSYTEEHSTRFAACIARRQSIPIFHVNGEDVDAVVRVARLATEYRYKFGTDVVIDLIGYRRHGHSEVDDPTVTQPLLYKKIKEHPPLWEIYADDTGATDARAQADAIKAEFEAAQKKASSFKQKPMLRELPKYWNNYFGGAYRPEYEVETGLSPDELTELTTRLTTYPADFHIHPKVKKLLEQRAEMGVGKRAVDYGMAEALAFASLVKAGTHVRFSGQDSRRGTFNQRHSVLVDIENENEYVPLENIAPNQARCEIYNSTLSEAGVLGFEYGYSRDYPESLVLWEAQFGDFVNVAQAIIDQFISAGEAKWNLLSGVVMLLPHGYEGQGPEHSSARPERFLQLCAEHNMQVCVPTTPAQIFHLLRRQMVRNFRKPLIVMSPKSLLRHKEAVSTMDELATGRFQTVIGDVDPIVPTSVRRVIVCSGKVYYDLATHRREQKIADVAIIRLEQQYPFPHADFKREIARYRNAAEVVWCQEEPQNQSAWYRLRAYFRADIGIKQLLAYAGRPISASPAVGYLSKHLEQQKKIVEDAFAAQLRSGEMVTAH
jgi:2-oxoglutarate dehydrogenase E1 component